jgi:hypothetical protein
VEDSVDPDRARFLVEFIFDGFAADRDFDDGVDAVRRIVADRDEIDVHDGGAP